MNRREFLTTLAAAGAAGALAHGANPVPTPDDAMPAGTIGKLKVSRLILGGNLLSNFTHSRDLQYVNQLSAHYNTEEKILQTLALAESSGINAVSVNNDAGILGLLKKHRKQGGKMLWVVNNTAASPVYPKPYEESLKELVDDGADAIFVFGVQSDQIIAARRADILVRAAEMIRKTHLPAGIAAHDLRVVAECEKANAPVDFYVKTLHHHRYPTAPRPEQIKGPVLEIPGYWCQDPQAVIDAMKPIKRPWIAFKVLAAGAVTPLDGFSYAFDNGADHILVGMYDFQIAADAEIARDAVMSAKRSRPWQS